MNGITTLGGCFMVLPNDKHATSPNDRRNRFLYRSNNAASYFFDNFKNKKIVDCYFYHKGENNRMTDWEDTQIETYIGF
jgi:signal peptidase I